ncbi:MAG: LD-carboxypeptidase [Myxococcales bacterium]|nr:LD-carboxypeptidase [Myxococcales bacterium]MCB9627628.1 LD-carboxypeptidase [Sandaracinaceae bacterium]
MTRALLVPPPLLPGDRVALIAPSGPFDRAAFERGVAAIEAQGYVCEHAPDIFARDGYFAGDDERRVRELRWALSAGEVRWLVAARGGFGATRLLPHISADEVRAAGKGLVGFSDITALHALWARAGVASLHASMVAKLGDAADATRARWFSALSGAPLVAFRGLECICDGRVEGPLVGGNLAVLAALVGTPFAPPLDGAILFLEDVGERPYRLDRMLTTLTQAGWFEKVRGLVFGAFTESTPGPDGVSARDVLVRHARSLGLPAVLGLPVGHVDDNHELPLGPVAALDASSGTLSWTVRG